MPQRLELAQEGSQLAGELDGDKLSGTVSGRSVHFVAKGEKSDDTAEYTGTLAGNTISGQAVMTDGGDGSKTNGAFTARRLPERPAGPARRHEFTSTTYYRQFSAATAPVLHVWPGDTIHTTTVDAGGTDGGGVTRVFGGNPQTGPFYIETALPGDVLAVHIDHLKLNRDWAVSTNGIVPRTLSSQLAVKMKDGGKSVTAGLVQWLKVDYKLDPAEIAEVLGTAIEYSISEVADRNAGIVAKIRKDRLATLGTAVAAKP